MGERRSDEQSDASTGQSVERLTITEAAQRLGVSRDAVYKRVKRGSIASETGVDGLLYVYIDPSIDESTDASTPTFSSPNEHLERLLTAQERELEYLREQLDAEREARRRADHIIAALTERIPELEAPPQTPQEAESVAESASEGESRGEDSEGPTEPQSSGELVPWWRKLFGRG
jgi:hypothetical protein